MLDLPAGWKIRFTAVDAATGDVVTDVKVSNASIMAASVAGDAAALVNTDWVLVPGPKQA